MEFTLTNLDLELMFENYDIMYLEYVDGCMFQATNIMFLNYITKWQRISEKAKAEGDFGMKMIAKLMMVSVYGKFGLKPVVKNKKLVYDKLMKRVALPYREYICTDENGVVIEDENGNEMKTNEKMIKPVYIPVAAFVTAYGRDRIIRIAQKIHIDSVLKTGKSRYIYSDTDSIHLIGFEIPDNIEIDNFKMGAFKIETIFEKAKYLRPKTYIANEYLKSEACELGLGSEFEFKISKLGETERNVKTVCAGLQLEYNDNVTYENFNENAKFKRYLPEIVSGGTILKETKFIINPLSNDIEKVS